MSNKSNRATVKKRSILLSGLFVLMMCLAGCSDDEQPDPQLPPLVWPDDVATAIPDEGFREYCLERHDKDKDGRLSKDEVLAVTSMINYDARNIRSFEGIEYFGNLEKLYWGYCDVPNLDLRYNTRLKRVRLEGSSNLVVFRGPVGYTPLTIEFLNPCRKLQTLGAKTPKQTFSYSFIPPSDFRKAASGNIFPIATLKYGIHTAAEHRIKSQNTVFIGKGRFVNADKVRG